MSLSRLEHTVFYALEKSIKTYRQFAQRRIRDGMGTNDITIDQWLVLKTLKDHPDISQKSLAEKVFKDYASVTRMIELLVKKGYLERKMHPEDRRRFQLELTALGELTYQSLVPIVSSYRLQALQGMEEEEVLLLYRLLNRIIENCNH